MQGFGGFLGPLVCFHIRDLVLLHHRTAPLQKLLPSPMLSIYLFISPGFYSFKSQLIGIEGEVHHSQGWAVGFGEVDFDLFFTLVNDKYAATDKGDAKGREFVPDQRRDSVEIIR